MSAQIGRVSAMLVGDLNAPCEARFAVHGRLPEHAPEKATPGHPTARIWGILVYDFCDREGTRW